MTHSFPTRRSSELLHVGRRAPMLYRDLGSRPEAALRDPLTVLDWVNLYALAVNEENAAGGRVVTAPTNGAAGIIPAVLHYYDRFCAKSNDNGVLEFLLTAGAIGILYKENARSEEHTSELQSLMRISYAVFCLKKKKNTINTIKTCTTNITKTNLHSNTQIPNTYIT